MTHSLLKRQLKKNGLSEDSIPKPETWKEFLGHVEKAYVEADKERYLVERSLQVSSQEMQEIYKQLVESENRYALSAKGANDGLWDWNIETDEYFYSIRWKDILGLEHHNERIPCKNCWLERIHPDDSKNVTKEMKSHLDGKTKHFQNEHRVQHSDGVYRWVLVRGMAVRNSEGKAIRIAGSMTDISERKQVEQKLAHDAVHDHLTGLPNRKKLMERLDELNNQTKSISTNSFGVLFIDIDRFKIINDSLGHQAGDELLLKNN